MMHAMAGKMPPIPGMPTVRDKAGRITEEAKSWFYVQVRNGHNPYRVGELMMVSRPTVRNWMKEASGRFSGGEELSPRQVAQRMSNPDPTTGEADATDYPNPKKRADLSKPALHAYREFGQFRSRYFHRRTIAWQIEMAITLMEWLGEARENGERGKGIINTPPGGGKTTTITHDFPAWLIARDRNMRIALGARTTSQSEKYVRRLRATFEKNALLNLEFGRFKPLEPEIWRKDQFIVDGVTGQLASVEYKLALAGFDFQDPKVKRRLEDEQDEIHTILAALENIFMAGEKESTVSALSQEMGFLGGRYDLNIWDDLCDRNNSRTAEQRSALTEWWHAEAESRCEPGGLVLLVGTRFGKFDLYRHCRDLVYATEGEFDAQILGGLSSSMSDEEIEAIKEDLERELLDKHGNRYGEAVNIEGHDLRRTKHVYKYVSFPAHNSDLCTDRRSLRASDHVDCLLDPQRFSYPDILRAEASDPRKFALTYQQEDEATEENLVQEVWLTGGRDKDGLIVPGCYNYNRKLFDIPTDLDPAVCYSVATVDPSAQNWWSIQWWIWDSQADKDYLIGMLRARLHAGGFLDWNRAHGEYRGIMHEYQTASALAGWPIGIWIMEQAGAQRYLFQYSWVQEWMKEFKTHIKGHETNRNKADPDLGVETLAPRYRYGLVDLPFDQGHARTRVTITEFKKELTEYPEGESDDMVMGHWFLHFNRYKLPKSLVVGQARKGITHPHQSTMPERLANPAEVSIHAEGHRAALMRKRAR